MNANPFFFSDTVRFQSTFKSLKIQNKSVILKINTESS